ncbi:MAG: hypothetical protein QOH36_641 [Actinomycetota bacterium]|nr:hypothetical protein [Actinomycetota bacterium]
MSALTIAPDIAAEVAELPTPRRTLVSIDTIDLTTVNERLFIPVADQLANIRRWNAERNWGFTEADFEAVDTTPVVHEKPFVVDVVAVWLPDDDGVDGIRRTFEELWAAASESVPDNWSWRQHLGGPRPVKLLPGAKHVPGIRRVTLDLAAGWDPIEGARAIEIRGRQSASAEILAAAAHFPEWIQAMEGVQVPFVYLGGYVVFHPENEAWRHVPCLSWNEFLGRVNLMDHWVDHTQRRWAVPVVSTPAP